MGWLSRLVCWSVSYTDRKAGYLGWYITSLNAGHLLVKSDRWAGYLGWYAGWLVKSGRLVI